MAVHRWPQGAVPCKDEWEDDTCRGDDAHRCVKPQGHDDTPHLCHCGASWPQKEEHERPDATRV